MSAFHNNVLGMRLGEARRKKRREGRRRRGVEAPTIFMRRHHHVIGLVVAQLTHGREGPRNMVPAVHFIIVENQFPTSIELGFAFGLLHN